jgi:hypothetical protein
MNRSENQREGTQMKTNRLQIETRDVVDMSQFGKASATPTAVTGQSEVAQQRNTPDWLIHLDRQIQRSKGSTKRQLQSLRQQQLQRHYDKAQAKADWQDSGVIDNTAERQKAKLENLFSGRLPKSVLAYHLREMDTKEARAVIAAYTHAEALAEALRKIQNTHIADAQRIAREALAQWDQAK